MDQCGFAMYRPTNIPPKRIPGTITNRQAFVGSASALSGLESLFFAPFVTARTHAQRSVLSKFVIVPRISRMQNC